MKKLVLIMGISLLMVFSISVTGFAKMVINTDKANQGIVTVMTTNDLTKRIKVRITKGNQVSTQDLTKAKEEVPFALTFGNGTYEVKLYEQVSGNQYSLLSTRKTFKVQIEDENKVYLNSTQEINYNENQRYIKLAKEITKDCKTDEEKINAVYDYITKNFTYDFTKIYRISSTYKPDLEKLFDEKKGICYDYSAIFAGMLRSLDIPTKMVKGYAVADQSTYHAWNQVLVNGEWKTVDTTNDAYRIQNNIKVDMYKADSAYLVDVVY
ncbi:MAG: transglutaminase-like domain-containing protein [Clostridia bacterium]|nr:transglutaminase-like domain-containing protein [Clostridia bacterium]